MIVTQKVHPRTGQIVTIGEYHRGEIRLAYSRLKTQLSKYCSYLWCEYAAKYKPKKPKKEFAAKLDHWRATGTLTVVTDDTVEHFKSHADGKMYSSKKKYRNELHGMGYEEIGNDTQEDLKHKAVLEDQAKLKDIKNDIERTWDGY
jgi:hypothetical protein